MELKWIMIGIAVVFVAMFASIGVGEYQKGQCKTAYTWSGKSAEDIVKICGK